MNSPVALITDPAEPCMKSLWTVLNQLIPLRSVWTQNKQTSLFKQSPAQMWQAFLHERPSHSASSPSSAGNPWCSKDISSWDPC